MRILTSTLLSLILFSCNESTEQGSTRLSRTESRSYTGYVLHTEYAYDNHGRITTITQYKDNEKPVVAVTIRYSGNEVVLLSFPDYDPSYDQTTEVHLTLDASGKMLKRIEHTQRVTKNTYVPPQSLIYDTLVCEYDAAGLLKKTTGGRYDTAWVDATHNQAKRFTSTVNYTTDGNLIGSDQYVVYPITTREGDNTTLSGGSSEYHCVFNYTKLFPNKTDFKNVAVLNEYKQYYETFLNINYKNMPDQMIQTNVDKDIHGAVIFSAKDTIEMERTYNGDGLLSSVKIPEKTQYREINYFYK